MNTWVPREQHKCIQAPWKWPWDRSLRPCLFHITEANLISYKKREIRNPAFRPKLRFLGRYFREDISGKRESSHRLPCSSFASFTYALTSNSCIRRHMQNLHYLSICELGRKWAGSTFLCHEKKHSGLSSWRIPSLHNKS